MILIIKLLIIILKLSKFLSFDLNLANAQNTDIKETYVIEKGEYLKIRLNKSKTIYNSSEKVISITDDGAFIQILGKTIGESIIANDHHNYKIIVTTPNQKKFSQQLDEYLQNTVGLELYKYTACFKIKGELLRWSDWKNISEIAKANNGCFQFEANIADEIKNEVQKNISVEFYSSQWGQPLLTSINPPELSFSFSAKDFNDNVKSLTSHWGLSYTFNNDILDIKPLIRINIIVAEINSNKSQQWGLSWPNSYGAHLLPKPQFEKNLELEIQALEAKGEGKMLASPTLLSRSGESAEFLAGGEIPIRVTKNKSREVHWKKYGVNLKVTPVADKYNHLKIELDAEVSSPDASFGEDGLVAFKTERVHSHFNLLKSRPISISGLLRNQQDRSKTGLMFLSNLPLIGLLFSSQNFQHHKSELIIIVTPKIVSELSEQLPQLPWDKEFNTHGGE